jgi:signal transduction histidine kinase
MAKTRRLVKEPAPARQRTAAVRAVAPKTASPGFIEDDAFFRHIVAGMRNGVLAVTRDGRMALINDEAYRIFGITPRPGDLGRPMTEVLRVHPDIVRVLSGVFELHHLPNRAEMRLKQSERVIGYTLALVRNDAQELVGVAMFFKDLTRVEQLEERERLRDRLVAVGELAATIAHEVKNPLASIEINAGRLRRKVAEPELQQSLTEIIAEAKMANAIVQEVLDFVRPIRLQVERTTVAEALRGAIQLAETKARRGDIAVDLDVTDGLPQIHGDAHQLMQLFTNLLTNAYEAMEGRGHIVLRAAAGRLDDGGDGRDAVIVECVDDGPGIPTDVAEKVFEPFFTTKVTGSGLGLAVVRKIVDAHDGKIDLQTASGKGTTIRVTLPVSASHEE